MTGLLITFGLMTIIVIIQMLTIHKLTKVIDRFKNKEQ